MDKSRNRFRIPSARASWWDYGRNATYFVTICTKHKEHFFGDVVDGKMELSGIGEIAKAYWIEIPNHFPFVHLDAFVIMPNHVHGVIVIDKQCVDVGGMDDAGMGHVETGHALSLPEQPESPQQSPAQQRFRNQGKGTLSAIIGSYKSARLIHADFTWQTRFHDHIISNQKSYFHLARANLIIYEVNKASAL